MTRPCRQLFATVLLVFGLPIAAAGAQLDVDQPISIDLKEASLRETLTSFAAIGGGELDMAADVTGSVSVTFERTTWRDAVTEICRQQLLDCRWRQQSAPAILHVRPAIAGEFSGLATDISMSLRQAPLATLVESFELFAKRPIERVGTFDGAVSLELGAAPWPEAFDYLCQVGGCRLLWSPDRLRIEAVDLPEDSHFDMVLAGAPTSIVVESMRKVHGLRQLQPLDIMIDEGVGQTVDIEVTGADWAQALDAVCASAGCSWQMTWGDPHVLHLIADDPRLEAAAPPPAGRTASVGELAHALAEAHGVALDIAPALDPRQCSKSTRPRCRGPGVRRFSGYAPSVVPGPSTTTPCISSHSAVPDARTEALSTGSTTAEHYLLLTLPGAERDQPAAAVIVNGMATTSDGSSQIQVMVIEPSADGNSLRIDRLELAPSHSRRQPLTAGDGRYEVRIDRPAL